MKKQVLSLLLALSLCLGLLPTATLAAEESDFTIEDGVLTRYNGPGGDVVIPDGVTSIGDDAFKRCYDLTSVTIPEGVTSIGEGAFEICTHLSSVSFPESLRSIGKEAFSGCALKAVVLPRDLETLGDYAFESCEDLTDVTIGRVAATCGYVFSGCSSLTSVTLLEELETLPEETLRKVLYPDFRIGQSKSVRTGQTYTSLFEYTGTASHVEIPEGVTGISNQAFRDCANLTSVTFPKSLTYIDGQYIFGGCTSLTELAVPDWITEINALAFARSSIQRLYLPTHLMDASLTLPAGCVKIGPDDSVGSDCLVRDGKLIEYMGSGGRVVIPDGVTEIPQSIFQNNTAITQVVIPGSVTTISNRAFSGCTGLTEISIPDGVGAIYSGAFSGCSSLSHVDLPSSVAVDRSAFPENTTVTLTGQYFDIKDGVLIKYNGPGGDVVVPEGVVEIAAPKQDGEGIFVKGPFQDKTTITSLTLPDSLKKIDYGYWRGNGEAPFEGCTNLKRIVFGDNLEILPRLSNLPSLEQVSLPANLTTIPDSCFWNCSRLTEITIPSGVTNIGNGAFAETGITSLVIPEGVRSCGSFFEGESSLRELSLPSTLESRPKLQKCPELRKLILPKDCWAFKGISRADFMDYISGCPKLEEIVNCPNEFVDDLVASNMALRDNWTDPQATIVAQPERIVKLSNEITAGLTTDYDKAKAISQWVVDHIKYDDDYYYAGLKDYSDVPFDPQEILDKGQAVCAGISRLTQALLVVQKIPCLYVHGTAGGAHAWNLALIDGEYLWIDNTWGMDYFGLGVYAISQDHRSTSAASFNNMKGPGTLVQTDETADETETSEEQRVRAAIEALKTKYPEGMSWTNVNSYHSDALHTTGYGCAGFAYICSDAAFGSAPVTDTHSDFDKIRVGDVLHINNGTHYVVVLEKRANSVVVAEGNYNSSIHWGREITRAKLENGKFVATTRWGGAPAAGTATATAYASTQTVLVDGKDVTFYAYALKDANGYDTNYIKLRDVADVLSGSAAQFQVDWDGDITITTHTAYTRNGTEMVQNFQGDQTYAVSASPVTVDGAAADMEAITLTDAAGGGYTYFKLRDLGEALGFDVSWTDGKIVIDPSRPYDPSN